MKALSKCTGAALLMVICSCGTPAIITSSWHRSNVPTSEYNNIFVSAITAQFVDKITIERDMQNILQQKGLKVEKSFDVFPRMDGEIYPQPQNALISDIARTGADGILVITLLRKDKQPVFRPLPPWEPTGADYVRSHPDELRNPNNGKFEFDGFYKDDIVYYAETRFYNTKSKKLVWAAASKTYDPNNMEGFVKGYVQTIYDRMLKDGVIAMANPR